MKFSALEILARITELSNEISHRDEARSLTHAYIATLCFKDLCSAIENSLDASTSIKLALRSRLLRLLREDADQIDKIALLELIEHITIESDKNKRHRPAADALHSAVFPYLPLPTQQTLLDRWADRGTRAAMARWLKATAQHLSLFDIEIALTYWRHTKDPLAAKNLAYLAPLDSLSRIISEIAENCEEGWIIAKAILRTETFDQTILDLVREKHPATYLYICARTKRPISDDEAFELVLSCRNTPANRNRGLAVWAIGQMKMVRVLDRVRDAVEMLNERDEIEFLHSIGLEPPAD